MTNGTPLLQRKKRPEVFSKKARDWQSVVNGMSPVQKLVHLAMRMDSVDIDRTRTGLLKAMRRAYEDELTIQARRAGCDNRAGRLNNNDALTALNDAAGGDAESIVNTYNFDLAGAIVNIASETPSANRNTYVKRLMDWEDKRNTWKAGQIAGYTEGAARSMAQQDFFRFNNIGGTAELMPTEAVCPICQGWVNRGEVSLREAENNPPPYHANCPHLWETFPEQVPDDECADLWMGE